MVQGHSLEMRADDGDANRIGRSRARTIARRVVALPRCPQGRIDRSCAEAALPEQAKAGQRTVVPGASQKGDARG